MAQYFYINSNSVNPTLRVELAYDGKYDFFKGNSFNDAIQNADIRFTMSDEHDILIISKAPCNLIEDNSTCEQRFIIEYQWKPRDTRRKGVFNGRFEIDFGDDLSNANSDENDYPKGKYIFPVYEELKIEIK